MKKIPYVWKLVDNTDTGEFISIANLSDAETIMRFRLTYKIGEETRPNIGKIFAFQTKEHAMKHLLDSLCDYTILKCTYTGKIKKAPYISYDNGSFLKFWAAKNHTLKESYIDTAPEGTIFVDSVTPIAVVK